MLGNRSRATTNSVCSLPERGPCAHPIRAPRLARLCGSQPEAANLVGGAPDARPARLVARRPIERRPIEIGRINHLGLKLELPKVALNLLALCRPGRERAEN